MMTDNEVSFVLKSFLPDEFVKSVFHIKPEVLKDKGIKGIITDLDNTLVEWDRAEATAEIQEWFANMKQNNIKVIIVSNNNYERVRDFAKPIGIPFIYKARKPLMRAFLMGMKMMKLKKEETVVIGDQLLTDVFGGNRAGFHTILVIPVAKTDGFKTKFNRIIERRIMASFKRKGLIKWEDEM